MKNQPIRRVSSLIIAMAALLAAFFAAFLFTSPVAYAHAGHDHDASAFDGRIPGLGDFKRHGDTTYRFLRSKGEYEVRVPGQPRFFIHSHPGGEENEEGAATTLAEEEYEGPGGDPKLPEYELAPICRTSGNRIVIVYSHRPSDTTPVPKETLRSIVRRMNWKIADQSSLSSNKARVVRMATDCDKEGNISIYEIKTVNNDWDAIWNATNSNTGTGGQLFGAPKGGDAIKYLVFDSEGGPSVAGATWGNVKSRENPSAKYTMPALVGGLRWEYHTPIHELFHTLGAVQVNSTPAPPFSDGKGHCVDGLDMMCSGYEYCTESMEYNYNTPLTYPIDCGKDTYFNAAPKSGTWLAKYWNLAGQENPFLVTLPTQPPKAETNKATSIRPYSAVLHGTVTPNADYAAYYFEYGTTASYGKSAPAPRGVSGFGANPTPVSAGLAGLTQQTTYHYRVVAVNDAGEKSYGYDQVFETVIPSATLCKAAEEGAHCAGENRYPVGTNIKTALYSVPTINTSLGVSVVCLGSTLEAKTTATAGLLLPFTIMSWTLSNCVDSSETANCAATVQEPVEKGSLLWANDNPEPYEAYDYFGTFTLGGEGNESLLLKCTGSIEIDCVYEVAPELTVQAGPGYDTYIHVVEAKLEKHSGVCPSESSFGVAYIVTSPKPLYVAYGGRGPTAVMEAASAIGANSATLKAKVNPQGLATKYHFEYDTSEYKEGKEAHGTSVPVSDKSIGSGTSDVEVSETVSGLVYGTTYHYRVVASNEIGTTYGKDEIFTTKKPTTLCKAAEAGSTCLQANRYPSGTTLKAGPTKVEISTDFVNVACGASTLEGKTTSEADYPLPISVSAWSLGTCGFNKEMTNCKTTTTEHLPYAGSLLWSEGANGTLALANGGSGQPGWHITCTNVMDCTFTLEPSLTLKGGNPAQLVVPETSLGKAGGSLCPEKATLKAATYTVESPKPVYVKQMAPATTFCKANAAGSCAKEDRYPSGTTLKAGPTKVEISTDLVNVACGASTLEGKTSSEADYPLPISVSAWSLGTCGFNKEMTNCKTTTTEHLPYAGSLLWSEGANGTLALANGGSGQPGWHITCTNVMDCTFTLEPSLTLKGGNPAQLVVPETSLGKAGGFCPEKATLKAATYTVESPKPVYVKRVY